MNAVVKPRQRIVEEKTVASKPRHWIKWIVLAAIVAGLYLWYRMQNIEPEIYLIPEGYVGLLIVAVDQEDGDEKEYEDGYRVYRMPSNGFLKTKFSLNTGWVDGGRHYYYVDSIGRRRELSDHDLRPQADSIVQVMGGGTGGYSNRELLKGKEVEYMVQVIDRPASKTSYPIDDIPWRKLWKEWDEQHGRR